MSTLNSSQVSLHSSWHTEDILRLDVIANGIPADLFGASFHLEGTGSAWSLDRYEIGDIFGGGDPLVVVKYQNTDSSKIVTGISLKRGSEFAVKQGKLMSFYIKADSENPPSFHFSHGVLSSFDGVRHDLTQVNWQGTTPPAYTSAIEKSTSSSSQKKSVSTTIESEDAAQTTDSLSIAEVFATSFSARLKSISSESPAPYDVDPTTYILLFLGTILVFIIAKLWKQLASLRSLTPKNTHTYPTTSSESAVISLPSPQTHHK